MLAAGDDGWISVVGNIGKARKSWGRLSRVLGREGASTKVSGNLYKAVAQSVLLFRAKTWVLTQRMEKSLGSFQSRVARRLTGKQPRCQTDGSWNYPPLAEELGEAGLEGIRKSVTRWQNTVAQYIATQPILDLCERANRRPGARVSWRCWEQDGIDLEGEKKRADETTTRLEPDSEEEADVESNRDSGGEEESQGLSGSSGAEWSRADE